MTLRRITAVLLMMIMILPYPFMDKVYADDADEIEFEVSAAVYEQQYKNDPDYEVLGQKTYYRYATRMKSTTTSGYDTMSGWTKYDTTSSTSTSGYKFGTPVSTSTSLKARKKYYVRVRTYTKVKGKTYYSPWSKAKTVTTKK